jgi:hypothetical protein
LQRTFKPSVFLGIDLFKVGFNQQHHLLEEEYAEHVVNRALYDEFNEDITLCGKCAAVELI